MRILAITGVAVSLIVGGVSMVANARPATATDPDPHAEHLAMEPAARAQSAGAPTRLQGTDERAKSMPEGKGKELVTTLCTKCHTLEVTLRKTASREQWRDTVENMIVRGAVISNDEVSIIASYLGEYYGPTKTAANTQAASASAVSTERSFILPDGPGKEVLMSKCFQCHNEGMWRDLRQDRRGWEGVLYRMVGRGALWTEEEINAMAEYLARAAGPSTGKRL